jgi:hypothetical protein
VALLQQGVELVPVQKQPAIVTQLTLLDGFIL